MSEKGKIQYMPIFARFENETKRLSDADFRQLFHAMVSYYFEDIEPNEDSDAIWLLSFDVQKERLDMHKQRYSDKCSQNADNANKRWHRDDTTAYDRIQPHATQCDGCKIETETEKEIEKEINNNNNKQDDYTTYCNEFREILGIEPPKTEKAINIVRDCLHTMSKDVVLQVIKYAHDNSKANPTGLFLTMLKTMRDKGVHDMETAKPFITASQSKKHDDEQKNLYKDKFW